ncbi:MAG: purine-nucleoside phosphorylase [Oscillospiraceae bacterium]|nr:purine-nucleoside phosphorylase [Oscillospiraceae bacterium]
MNKNYEKLLRCLDSVRKKTDFVPQVALILGSGLGAFGYEVENPTVIPYSEIDGFPVSTVPGHKGRLILGQLGGVNVVVMQGRVHYYEGYSVSDVVLPTRLMGLLGAKTLFLTNASGGINPDYRAGDFMLISDHIMSFFPNPLIGENIEQLGPRFPDSSEIYSKRLRGIIKRTAAENGIPLRDGVYCQLTGPSFESPAEIRMLSRMGADAVGMSTACEAIAARHMGMEVCGISCVTNQAAGISPNPLSHEEVQETADRVAPLFKTLIRRSIINIGKAGEQ